MHFKLVHSVAQISQRTYLIDFVEEVEDLLKIGILVGPRRLQKPFEIHALICDAIARALITETNMNVQDVTPNLKWEEANYGTTIGTDEYFANRRDLPHHCHLFRFSSYQICLILIRSPTFFLLHR